MVELAGIGPGPFAAMMLADAGADVIRVERTTEVRRHPDGPHPDVVLRGRRSVAVDLKHPDGRQVVLDLVAGSDALLEGFRPGVTERLGLGPADCHAVNPALVYGRMTGWGQDGPLATVAGHDIGYIAVTGALNGSRRAGGRPVPPMNLLGDMGGGGMMLAFGVVSALLSAARTGQGQVVDAAIVDGTAALANFVLGRRNAGGWPAPAGHNLLDTGAPFYEVYTCADGREIAVGALEPKFYAELLRLSGMDGGGEVAADRRLDPAGWPAAKQRWAELFATRTRDEWAEVFAGSDACVAPVLDWDEAVEHPQLAARGTYPPVGGVVQSAPAPRFDRTPSTLDRPPPWPGADTDAVLAELGRSGRRHHRPPRQRRGRLGERPDPPPQPGRACSARRDRVRRQGLIRMKAGATALLLVAAVVYVLARRAGGHGWVGYVEAAAEAGMVGGLADWFAVTALFRHPLGLPIPHTAIIPTRKDALGRNLSDFVGTNFLSEQVVRERLRNAEVPRRLGRWLAEPAHAARVTAELARALRGAVDVLRDEDVRAVLEPVVLRRLAALPVGPTLGPAAGPGGRGQGPPPAGRPGRRRGGRLAGRPTASR